MCAMKSSEIEIILVPDWNGISPFDWQGRWEAKLATAKRLGGLDLSAPDFGIWTKELVAHVDAAVRPVVLVGHGLGVTASVFAAPEVTPGKVIGAFLVAPVSDDFVRANPAIDQAFAPVPENPLPFPSLLIASRNDTACPYDEAGVMALAWGSALVDAGEAGHLNGPSGHGPWPEGLLRFAGFLKGLKPPGTDADDMANPQP